MAEIGTGAAKRHWVRDITGYQWLVLFIAWAGWSLDITDFTLYTMVLRQAAHAWLPWREQAIPRHSRARFF